MPDLFSKITIKNTEFSNRIVMPPMVRSIGQMPDHVVLTGGRVTDAVIDHYVQRENGGTGYVIVEATSVDPDGRPWADGLRLWADEHIDDLAKLTAAIKSAGARVGIQLVHGGPQASPGVTRNQVVGPSAVRDSEGKPLPRELSIPEILAIQQRFEDAADRAVQAGFEVIEIHGAHGYLLDSFLMKKRNLRSDEYGGDMQGRMRMLLQTLLCVRRRLGERALLQCRISPFNKLDEGLTADEFCELLTGLSANGVDILHISTDGAFKPYFDSPKTIGQWAKQTTAIPTIIAGGLREPADADRLIREGHADFAALGTALLQWPDWPKRARKALNP